MKLLKFYADWCAPCKALTPILKELLVDKNLPMEEVDIVSNKELTTKYSIRSIPALIIVNEEGNPVRELKGYNQTPEFKEKLKEFLTG